MTPIRKGANPVKIPFAIKSSDRTFAAWCNEVRTAIQQIEARQPTANVGRGASAGGGRPPFFGSVSRVPESDPPEYQATFTLGYLTYQNAGASESEQGVTGYIVPKIQGVSMERAEEKPPTNPAALAAFKADLKKLKIKLPDLVSFVYLRVKTDADGVPKFDNESVTIEAFDEAQESIHHVRPSPSGGEEEGDYYFLLLETESNGATPTPAPRVVRRLTGNREMPNQLIEITNIGGKRELYQGYLPGPDDKHELRTIEQIDARGEPVIKPLATNEEEGETIKWKRVADIGSGAQINVSTVSNGDVIEVRGNGFSLPYIDPFGNGINFDDGLATGLIEGQEGGGRGDNFNIELLNIQIAETGGEIFVTDIGWGTDPRKFYVRNGLLYLNDDGANVDTYEVISRIEGESNPSSNQSGEGFVPASGA